MPTDYIYPTREEQLPPYRLFTLDVIRETEPTLTPEGGEFYKYLGIRVYTYDQRVMDFYPGKQENFGELYIAQAWIEGQVDFLNNFWEVKDFKYIVTPEIGELIGLVSQGMLQIGAEEIRKKSMNN